MSVYAYDEALVQDLRRIFSDGRIHIVPPEDAFDLIGTLQKDKILFPMITLSRPGWLLSDNKPEHMIFEGLPDKITESKEEVPDHRTKGFDSSFDVIRLQALPIRINYQIDVWTESRLENDNIMRELIWYYTLHPTLNVKIVYEDVERFHHFNVFFDADVEDNSDIESHKDRGRYFRQTISMYTDDAYLWKTFKRLPNYVDPDKINLDINSSDINYDQNN